MTAINFPASPNPGDKWPTTGNIDGKVWAWDGTTWKIVSTNGTVTIIDNTARSFAFTVTYTNVPGSYNVVGTDRNGEVNGLNPTITVNEEDTLIFNVNASGHPFYLVWQHGGSSNQVGGGNGTNTASNQGTVNGTVTWVTDVGDGDALPTGELFYYQCGNHTNMYGTIKVLLKNTSDSASHIHDLIDLDDTPSAYDNGKYLRSTGTGTEWATVSGGSGGINDIVEDTTPQLGGDLDTNGHAIFDATKIDLNVPDAGTTVLAVNQTSVQHFQQILVENSKNLTVVGGDLKMAVATGGSSAGNIEILGGVKDKDGQLGNPGQVLSSTGTQVDWIDAPSGGASDLNDLGDVNAGSPGDGQVLKWQASTSKWIAAADQTSTGGTGISLTDLSRTNATAGSEAKLDYNNQTGVFTYTPLNMDPWVKVTDSTSTTISRTGSSYLNLTSDFYIQLSADQYVRIDGNNSVNINSSTGPLSVSVAGGITLSGGGVVDLKGTRVDFKDTSNTRYAFFDPSGLNLLTSGIKDKDGNLGTSGQILSSTGSSVDWIDAPGGEANQNAFSKIAVSGQSDVDAETETDTLTFVADGGMTITTDASGDSITFESTTYGAPTTSVAGLVPSLPLSEGNTKYLRGDGTWQVVSSGGADGNTTYDLSALISPGIKLTGSDGTNDSIFFDAGDGITLTRTSAPGSTGGGTIKFEADTFTGTDVGLVPDGSSAGNNKFLKSDGSWDDVTAGETNQFAFSKIAVNGQQDVDAETKTDTLTFEAAGAMTITTDNSSDKVTFSSTNTTYNDFTGTSRGLVPDGSSAGNNKFLKSDGSWDDVTAGEANQNAFSNVAVSGQSTVSADGETDTLTFVATGAMSITTNSSNDQITFNSTNTTYGVFSGGTQGLVPNGSSAGNDKFLKSDGTWDYAGGSATIQTDTGNAMHNLVFVDSPSSGTQTLKIDNATNSLSYNPSSNRLLAYEFQSYRMTEWSSGSTGTSGQFLMSKGSSGWVWSTHVSQNTTGELYLKRTSTYREGGHIQFEDQDGQSNTFAIDVYADDGTNNTEMIRIIDQQNNMQRFAVNHNGAWGIGHTNPDFGDTGEVMISRGSGQPPYWGNHSNISGSSFATAAQGATADTANSEIDHIYSQLNAIGNDDSITTVAQLKTALLALVRN